MQLKSTVESPVVELCSSIAARTACVGVIGMGYVGLPLALLFSKEGFPVTGFDIDQKKVSALNNGESYIAHLAATEIQSAQKRGFAATSDYAELRGMDAIIICVPTPLDEHDQPDLSYVTGTATAVAPHLRRGQLVVLESTTYPGTTQEILIPILEQNNCEGLRGEGSRTESAEEVFQSEDGEPVFYAAFSPEREDPGNSSIARYNIPKVIGAIGPVSAQIASALYGAIFSRIVPVSSPAVAEMSKLLENIYRCVNIALVNELKQLCIRMGLDIFEIIEAAKSKPFGFQAFYPGPGLGGHCIPVDPFYLSWKAREFDFRTRFIELAGEINTRMPYYVIERLTEALNDRSKSLNGSKVLVLGVAYKKDIDDLRESPALTIIELLRQRGAEVSYNDPYLPYVGHGRHYDLNMASMPLSRLGEYDGVLIVTDHSAYDYRQIVAEAVLVVDTRNATAGIDSPNIVRC